MNGKFEVKYLTQKGHPLYIFLFIMYYKLLIYPDVASNETYQTL